MKKIVFWMPRACMEPAGGFKIVFEYANRLAKDGFPVEIIYPMVHYGARYDWKHTIISCPIVNHWVYNFYRKTI